MTRILIIEDEESYREALTFMLRKEGFDVVAEPDGEAGIAEYERNGADLVLLDLMLPACREPRCAVSCVLAATSRSSWSPRVIPRRTRLWGLRSAPTIM